MRHKSKPCTNWVLFLPDVTFNLGSHSLSEQGQACGPPHLCPTGLDTLQVDWHIYKKKYVLCGTAGRARACIHLGAKLAGAVSLEMHWSYRQTRAYVFDPLPLGSCPVLPVLPCDELVEGRILVDPPEQAHPAEKRPRRFRTVKDNVSTSSLPSKEGLRLPGCLSNASSSSPCSPLVVCITDLSTRSSGCM